MSDLILYILMRNDLPSMNGGKAMAQASHASNAFVKTFGAEPEGKAWQASTDQGFGTVLVLSVNYRELSETVQQVWKEKGCAEIIKDPTYPYRVNKEIAQLIDSNRHDTAPRTESGDQVTLYREEVTCAYVFGLKEKLQPILGKFPLHP